MLSCRAILRNADGATVVFADPVDVTEAGAEPINPQTLFSSGQNGMWFDPFDTASLGKEAWAGSGVPSDSDAVGYCADKSGRGWHMNTWTASRRPIFGSGDGLRWLQFDGVDDVLFNPVGPRLIEDALGSGDYAVWVAGRWNSVTTDSATPSSNACMWGESSANWSIFARSSGLIGVHHGSTSATAPYTIGTDFCLGIRRRGGLTGVKVNGGPWMDVAMGPQYANAWWLCMGTQAESSSRARFNGRLYASIFRTGDITDEQHAGCEAYCKQRAGL